LVPDAGVRELTRANRGGPSDLSWVLRGGVVCHWQRSEAIQPPALWFASSLRSSRDSALKPVDQFAPEHLFGGVQRIHELPQFDDLAVAEAYEMREHALHRAVSRTADSARERHDGRALRFDHH